MSPKSKKRERTVQFVVKDTGYPRVVFYNRFNIEDHGDYLFLTVGFENLSKTILDSFSFVITKSALVNQVMAISQKYIAQLISEVDVNDAAGNLIDFTRREVSNVAVISSSHSNEIGEMNCSGNSIAEIANGLKNPGQLTIECLPIAKLQTHISTHAALLKGLMLHADSLV